MTDCFRKVTYIQESFPPNSTLFLFCEPILRQPQKGQPHRIWYLLPPVVSGLTWLDL